jgi:hypothetical protein
MQKTRKEKLFERYGKTEQGAITLDAKQRLAAAQEEVRQLRKHYISEPKKRLKLTGLNICCCGKTVRGGDKLCATCGRIYREKREKLQTQIELLKKLAHRCIKCQSKTCPAATLCSFCNCNSEEAAAVMQNGIDRAALELLRQESEHLPAEKRTKKLARWLTLRQRTAIPDNTAHRLAVCDCGRRKPLSAAMCTECQDARHIIKRRTPWRINRGVQWKSKYYLPKIVTKAMPDFVTRRGRRTNTDYDKTTMIERDNNSFDNIVKLYEECRD